MYIHTANLAALLSTGVESTGSAGRRGCLSGLSLNRLLSQHSRFYWQLNAAGMCHSYAPLQVTSPCRLRPPHQAKTQAHSHSVRKHDQHFCCQLFSLRASSCPTRLLFYATAVWGWSPRQQAPWGAGTV